LLRHRPKASGIVFDLPEVTAEQDQHVARLAKTWTTLLKQFFCLG
jgi:hypothetical protein